MQTQSIDNVTKQTLLVDTVIEACRQATLSDKGIFTSIMALDGNKVTLRLRNTGELVTEKENSEFIVKLDGVLTSGDFEKPNHRFLVYGTKEEYKDGSEWYSVTVEEIVGL
jgi:hypothetical protein